MKKTIYNQYKGKLTIKDIDDGIRKCLKNACCLLEEAKRNQKMKKYNLAYFLAYTSGEEFIKLYLLLHYFVIVKKEGIENFWKYYRNHISKNRLNLLERHEVDKYSKKVYLENIYFLLNEKGFQNIRSNSLYCDSVYKKGNFVFGKEFVVPFDNFEERDCVELLKDLEKRKEKWGKVLLDKKTLNNILKYTKKNPDRFVSPSQLFIQTHGKKIL